MQQNIVISLGGNALGTKTQTLREMADQLAESIVDLTEEGYRPLLCHGNGPQVGALQNAFGTKKHINGLEAIELADSVAMTQSYMGYQLQNALETAFHRRGLPHAVSTVVTRVRVNPDDPRFLRPTKPVGPFYTEEEAALLQKQGKNMKEDAGRGWREVVASPEPVEILEMESIRLLARQDVVVIAGGGGGIPVWEEEGRIVSVNAVIDKDFVSALLAESAQCERLIILTGVDYVYRGFLRGEPEKITHMTVKEARKYMEDGEFAEGSMLPKRTAAIRFAASAPGRSTLITSVDKLREGLRGEIGTIIVSEE